MEVGVAAWRALAIERGFGSNFRFQPVQYGEQFCRGEFLLKQLAQSLQKSFTQRRIVQKPIGHPVPTCDSGQLPRAEQRGKLRMVEESTPMIAQCAVQVPGHGYPFLRTATVVDQEMVFVEAVPILHQDGRLEVID